MSRNISFVNYEYSTFSLILATKLKINFHTRHSKSGNSLATKF